MATLRTIQDLQRNSADATNFISKLLKVERSHAAESYNEMIASIIANGVPT